jgi:hypothetical protein
MSNASLNPTLYDTLQAKFGEVRLTHPGQQRVARRVPDPARPGQFTTRATERGEQLVVCCPFCGDTRFRLYVSYMCGQKDPFTGKPNHRLWYCQNERCHESETNRKIFRSMIAVPLGRRRQSAVCASTRTAAPQPAGPIELPSGLIPIAALPATHPAPAYLLRRGFDLSYLQQTWDISFCDSCLNCRPVATNRIVIPIHRPARMFAPTNNGEQDLVLAGWQARSVPGIDPLAGADAKYLFAEGMQKSELLYGLHLAIASQGPVYLVEGPTDCWRIGPGALAIFGKDLSRTQKLLLVHHFAGRPIIVMLDPDAWESAGKVQYQLCLARGNADGDNRVVIADLPNHREDPADCTREELIQAAAEALGQGPQLFAYTQTTNISSQQPSFTR